MRNKYLALCGGVGGSKLADGLARILPPEQLTIVVNTADDFDHLGLRICPDIDTVTYMLGGIAHPKHGWGRVDETWACMEALESIGGPTWFRLGDRDLALHLHRTERLKGGATLSGITADTCRKLGILHVPVPMTEQEVRTVLQTEIGDLSFQDYFVRHQCQVKVLHVRYVGSEKANPSDAFLDALLSPDLAGIIIAPSNPFLSIAPILATAQVRQIITQRGVPVIAVSPLIGGKAVKGPADKLMAEIGHPPGIEGLAAFYGNLIHGLLIDHVDYPAHVDPALCTSADSILMTTAADRQKIAGRCIEMVEGISR